MGKTSYSVKKKRSKNSSQARIKKRSKSRTRRNYKLKKLRRRDDSVSYSSDSDDSRSSVSVSSSSFDDGYRRKRSRSRTRKDVKVSKKSARRRSSSCASIEDSSRVKKRKRSKKNDDFRVSKKSREKKNKKTKRDVSFSSASSGSWSCSTCRGGSSSSDETEVKKNRGRFERKNGDRRRLEKVKNESKRRRSRTRSRSRSCSSLSRCSDYRSEDKLIGEANPRRLRSVITIARDGQEGNVMDNDEHKEEMVYDHHDYPSSRSNDSNDGGNKREFIYNSDVASEGKKHAEDEKGEAVVSNIGTCKVEGSDKDTEGHEMNDDVKAKKTEDSGAVDSLSRYDLESILRQKALENLRMFRTGHQTDLKIPVTRKDVIGSEVNALSSTKSVLSQNRSLEEVGDRVIGASQVAERSNISADLSWNDGKISNRNDNNKESGSAKHDIEHPPGQLALSGNPNERVSVTVGSESDEPQLVALASRRESSSSCTTKKLVPALQEPPQEKSMAGNRVDKGKVKTAQTAIPLSGNSNHEQTNNVFASDDPSSCTKSPSGGTISNKQQDEANDGLQFQQKTMSVMRGGEMVEVSYKVYIPKKAPALARRSLNR